MSTNPSKVSVKIHRALAFHERYEQWDHLSQLLLHFDLGSMNFDAANRPSSRCFPFAQPETILLESCLHIVDCLWRGTLPRENIGLVGVNSSSNQKSMWFWVLILFNSTLIQAYDTLLHMEHLPESRGHSGAQQHFNACGLTYSVIWFVHFQNMRVELIGFQNAQCVHRSTTFLKHDLTYIWIFLNFISGKHLLKPNSSWAHKFFTPQWPPWVALDMMCCLAALPFRHLTTRQVSKCRKCTKTGRFDAWLSRRVTQHIVVTNSWSWAHKQQQRKGLVQAPHFKRIHVCCVIPPSLWQILLKPSAFVYTWHLV